MLPTELVESYFFVIIRLQVDRDLFSQLNGNEVVTDFFENLMYDK